MIQRPCKPCSGRARGLGNRHPLPIRLRRHGLPARTGARGATRCGGCPGCAHPDSPRCPHWASKHRGRSPTRPHGADRHRRSGCRGATARWPATCGTGGVSGGMAKSVHMHLNHRCTPLDRHRRPRRRRTDFEARSASYLQGPVDHRAILHHDPLSVDITLHATGGSHLQPRRDRQIPLDTSRHRGVLGGDIASNHAVLADDNSRSGFHISFDSAFDMNRARGLAVPDQGHACADDRTLVARRRGRRGGAFLQHSWRLAFELSLAVCSVGVRTGSHRDSRIPLIGSPRHGEHRRTFFAPSPDWIGRHGPGPDLKNRIPHQFGGWHATVQLRHRSLEEEYQPRPGVLDDHRCVPAGMPATMSTGSVLTRIDVRFTSSPSVGCQSKLAMNRLGYRRAR